MRKAIGLAAQPGELRWHSHSCGCGYGNARGHGRAHGRAHDLGRDYGGGYALGGSCSFPFALQ